MKGIKNGFVFYFAIIGAIYILVYSPFFLFCTFSPKQETSPV
jgi:hypothetical protein